MEVLHNILTAELEISLWVLVTTILAALLIGHGYRKAKMLKLTRRITELEQEMMQNHAEILRLESQKL